MSASQRTTPEQPTNHLDRAQTARKGDDAVLLEWSVHLLRRDPRRVWGVVFVALCAAVAGIVFFKSIVVALAGALLMLSSAAEFVFPIRHRLSERGASCRFCLTRYEIGWSDVRRLLPTHDGVKLSPLAVSSRLDAFRGVLLRFATDGAPGCRAQVMEIVEMRMASCREDASAPIPQVSQGV